MGSPLKNPLRLLTYLGTSNCQWLIRGYLALLFYCEGPVLGDGR